MNSINFSGELSGIKTELFDIVASNEDSNGILKRSAPSFTAYKNSKHIGVIVEYSSEEISLYRDNLVRLWEDDEAAKKFIPVLLRAYRKTKETSESRLPEIDLYNYMM